MSPADTLLAGLDVGTTHIKAGVYRSDGTAVVQRQAATPTSAHALCDTALRLLAECVSAAPVPPIALGIASMAETGVPLDSAGDPAGELLGWRDRRAVHEADELAAEVGAATFFATTGLHPSAKLPLARWIWLRRHDPSVLRRTRTWANCADLVAAALTGTVATSPTLAARTGAFDIKAGAYRPELLDLAGLRPDQMPPVADPVAGRVTASGAARTGLLAGTPVVVAGHDHMVAAWAAGVRAPGHTADSMGTSEAIVTPVAVPPPPQAMRHTGTSVGPFVDGRSFCLISGLASSGGLIDWLLDRMAPGGQDDRHQWFNDLIGPPGSHPTGITVEPYLQGRASPRPDPGRTLSLHGIRPEHTTADVGRAVVEGLCMQARWMLDTQATISGHQPDTVTVFGGPTANPTWMWIKTQVSLVPLRIVPEQRCAALGAAQLAGRALGVASTPIRGQPRHPASERAAEWDAAYRSGFLPMAQAESLAQAETRHTSDSEEPQ